MVLAFVRQYREDAVETRKSSDYLYGFYQVSLSKQHVQCAAHYWSHIDR